MSLPVPPTWQDAWNSAQSSFDTIRGTSSNPSSPYPTPRSRVIRVGQLDSSLLDQELVHILLEPVNKAIGLVKPAWKSRFTPELMLLVEMILYHGSIWSQGSSYGARLQGLRYQSARAPIQGGEVSPARLPQKILLAHAALTILTPYLHSRIRSYALSKAWPDRPLSDKRRKAWRVLAALESGHSALALVSFMAFLFNGRHRTIADRLVGLRLVPSTNVTNRNVSYEFMKRQMVWHAFTEFLLFLLPLVPPRLIWKRILRVWAASKRKLGSPQTQEKAVTKGPYWALPSDQCAICAENASYSLNVNQPINVFTSISSNTLTAETTATGNGDEVPAFPIHTAYVASCGDVFCYSCLAERMLRVADDEGEGQFWECIRCGTSVRSADRQGPSDEELVGSSEASGAFSDYEFSSDLDTDTGMSASFTYSDYSRRSDE